MIHLFTLLALIPGPSFAANVSFYFSTDESPELRANVYVADSHGVKAGYLEDGTPTDTNLGGGYGVDRIDDDETGDFGNALLEINVRPLKADAYTVTVHAVADTKYELMRRYRPDDGNDNDAVFTAFITSGTTHTYSMSIANPAVPPVLSKTVTFDVLRNDISVAHKLNQLGDDKFTASLARNIDLAEKLAGVCDKRKTSKPNGCEPAANALKLFIKRLELANRKCDGKDPKVCDEEKDWDDFRKAHGRDHDYDDFFRAWDKDEWHKHKKACKRFVTDEALGIIRSDAEIQIKTFVPDKSEHKGSK